MSDLVMQSAVAELQIVILNQVVNIEHGEGNSDRDADRADRQQLHGPLNTDRAVRPDPFQRRQAHHLWAIEKKLFGTPLAGIDSELRHRPAQQFTYW